MNEVLRCIRNRRSVRAFTNQKIEQADLERIVEAGCYAPSGMNRQTWHFTVVQDPEQTEMLARALRVVLKRDEGYCFYSPNAMILVSNERTSSWGAEDSACAMENMMLAAHSLGIGSVWINQFRGVCDEPLVREALGKLGLSENQVVFAAVALGYAAATPKDVPRKEGTVTWCSVSGSDSLA